MQYPDSLQSSPNENNLSQDRQEILLHFQEVEAAIPALPTKVLSFSGEEVKIQHVLPLSIIRPAYPTYNPAFPIEERIIAATAKAYGVEQHRLLAGTRKHNYTDPRQLAVYLISQQSDVTPAEIGKLIHCNQSTVLDSIEVIEERLATEEELRGLADLITTEVWNDYADFTAYSKLVVLTTAEICICPIFKLTPFEQKSLRVEGAGLDLSRAVTNDEIWSRYSQDARWHLGRFRPEQISSRRNIFTGR